MSVRLKLITTQATALFVMLAGLLGISFLLFLIIARPVFGVHFSRNIGFIASRFFVYGSLAVIFLTGLGVVWFWGSALKRVVDPLNRLKRAAAEIRDGNLDYELVISGSDEFYQLALSFEQMRVRLKNSTLEGLRAQEERTVMMAGICHDLGTPVTAILGYAEGILDGVASDPKKIREYASVIRKKAVSLQKLTDDLSLLSRLETSRLALDMSAADLSGFLRQYTDEQPDNVIIETDIDNHITVCFDKEKLGRVLTNLIQNSQKYGSDYDGRCYLNISLRCSHSMAHITIGDKGGGVAKEELISIFERFYRTDTARSGEKGSGLGLSIARHIVTLHGGKIWAALPENGGFEIHITLPLYQSERSLNDV